MTQRTRLSVALIGVALSSAVALAQDQSAPSSPVPGVGTTTLACINAGSQYQVGEFACIAACHGQRRLARCDQVAERVSWTYVSEACPTAMINPPWPSDWSEIPALSEMSPIPLVVDKSAPVPEAKVLAFASFTADPALSN
jgi:hypothetical protein